MQNAIQTHLWAEELRLWTAGIEDFAKRLAPHCLMAFPGLGILRGAEIAASLENVPRWRTVQMTRQNLSEHHGAAVLAYRALAQRPGGEAYMAWCTSCWVPKNGDWKMVQHQQSPQAA